MNSKAERIKKAIDDLSEVGWKQNAIAVRLGIGNSTLSRMKSKGLGYNIDKVIENLERLVKEAELPGEATVEPTPKAAPKVEYIIPARNGGSGILDDLRHASHLLEELDKTLARAEQGCLPLLRPGIAKALEEARRLHKMLRIG